MSAIPSYASSLQSQRTPTRATAPDPRRGAGAPRAIASAVQPSGVRSRRVEAATSALNTGATAADSASQLGLGMVRSSKKLAGAIRALRGQAGRVARKALKSTQGAARALPGPARRALKAVTGGRVFRAVQKRLPLLDAGLRATAVLNSNDPAREAAVQATGWVGALAGAETAAAAAAVPCLATGPLEPICVAAAAVTGGVLGGQLGEFDGGGVVDVYRAATR